jgi:S1-C subfamily serine protease
MEMIHEQIERYLEGHLQGEELREFEGKLENDPAFKKEVESFRDLTHHLQKYGERRELKEKLAFIHQEMKREEKTPFLKRAITFRTSYRILAVAASVALVVSLSTFWIWKGSDRSGKEHYLELRRDVESIKLSHKKLLKEVYADKKASKMENFSGTGFAIHPSGLLITSYHVVKEADSVEVENDRYGRQKAEVMYVNKQMDLAVLKVSTLQFAKLPYLLLTKSKRMGDRIFTLGYPREEMVYGEGYVGSETGYEGDTSSYQIAIPVNPGNSGGPLLDEKGNVVGMVSGKHAETEGAAFALKSKYIKAVLQEMKKQEPLGSLTWSNYNALSTLSRPEQIRLSKDFVFKIRVYE